MDMITPDPRGHPSPYQLTRPPRSPGRAFLATAFQHYCQFRWGLSGTEVAQGFLDAGAGPNAERVVGAAALLGEVFARGWVRTWARPIGGGTPAELKPAAWELDDPARRFATSAVDPRRPFDPGARPTHWIFVDLDAWTLLLDAGAADWDRRGRAETPTTRPARARAAAVVDTGADAERLLRLPEVTRRTGLSRSTIYRKIQSGTFPAGTSLSGSITVWREGDVARWVRNPT